MMDGSVWVDEGVAWMGMCGCGWDGMGRERVRMGGRVMGTYK